MGGADLHCKISGVTDHYAIDDEHALHLARNIIKNLNNMQNASNESPMSLTSINARENNVQQFEEPCYDSKEIYGIVESDLTKLYDVREIIARIVDGSQFHFNNIS